MLAKIMKEMEFLIYIRRVLMVQKSNTIKWGRIRLILEIDNNFLRNMMRNIQYLKRGRNLLCTIEVFFCLVGYKRVNK